MSKFSQLTLSAAMLLGSVATASAVEVTGGSVGLTFSQTDIYGVTADGTGIDGVVGLALSNGLSANVLASSTTFSFPGGDVQDSNFGGSIAFAVTPNATIGAYYERLRLKADGSSTGFDANNYGIEGSYDFSSQAKASAYLGTVDGSDVSGSEDMFGIRGDFALSNVIGLYASYESDDWGGGTDYVSKFGGSYDLSASGLPIRLEAGLGQIGGDSYSDTYSSYYVGARYVFGGKDPATTGFAAGHSGIYGSAGF